MRNGEDVSCEVRGSWWLWDSFRVRVVFCLQRLGKFFRYVAENGRLGRILRLTCSGTCVTFRRELKVGSTLQAG